MGLFDDTLGTLKALAPTIATAIGGPVGGFAVKALGEVFGVEFGSKDEALEAVKSATPEQLLAMKQADQSFALQMKSLGIDVFKLEVADKQSAREHFSKDGKVFWLGVVVLMTFAATVGAACFGAFHILTGGMAIKDLGVVAAVFGFLGTIIGYVAANAQQVIGYFFGSSQSGEDNGKAMAAAFAKLGG
jgi:hypothetical protein